MAMNDTISREDARNAVQDHFNDDGFKGYFDGQKMMDRINALPSAEAEWIPCSERLPKTGEQVLCCDSQSRVFTSALTEIASNGMTFFGQHCKVIAWMPLPKPYEERRKP